MGFFAAPPAAAAAAARAFKRLAMKACRRKRAALNYRAMPPSAEGSRVGSVNGRGAWAHRVASGRALGPSVSWRAGPDSSQGLSATPLARPPSPADERVANRSISRTSRRTRRVPSPREVQGRGRICARARARSDAVTFRSVTCSGVMQISFEACARRKGGACLSRAQLSQGPA